MAEMRYAMRIYQLADALGMALDGVGEDGKLTGGRVKKWRVQGVTFEFNQKIVSSGIVGDHIMVIAKIAGNLAVLVGVDPEGRVEAHILNLTHLKQSHNWIEDYKPKDRDVCLNLLGEAIVRSFRKIEKKGWEQFVSA